MATINKPIALDETLQRVAKACERIANSQSGESGGGVSDYDDLENKPLVKETDGSYSTTNDIILKKGSENEVKVSEKLATLEQEVGNFPTIYQKKLKAGANINIEADGTISATGGGSGSTNLYSERGQQTDGAPTNKLLDDELSKCVSQEVGSVRLSANLLDPSKIVYGYINTSNGKIVGGVSTRCVTDYIPIDSVGLYVYRYSGYGVYNAVAYYDEDKTFIAGTNPVDGFVQYYEGASFVRVTMLPSYIGESAYINKATDGKGYMTYADAMSVAKASNELVYNSRTSFNKSLFADKEVVDEEYMTINEVNNIHGNKHLVFSCDIGTFGSVEIGHGVSGSTSSKILIDDTNVEFRTNTTILATKPHGLDIANNIQVAIHVKANGDVQVILQSNGVSMTMSNYNWYGDTGSPYVRFVSGTYSNAHLSWICEGYTKDIHLYGDSYIGTFNPARWATYLVQDGYASNVLIDGFGGRTSAQALDALIANVQHSNPKYIVWSLGMNNADSDTEVNASWNATLNIVQGICDGLGIKLILATIPNTPTQRHDYKNAIVRASGLRYVDFASAVNANEVGSPWIDGMLSSDNVHPTVLGARALYMRFLQDFPEVMIF